MTLNILFFISSLLFTALNTSLFVSLLIVRKERNLYMRMFKTNDFSTYPLTPQERPWFTRYLDWLEQWLVRKKW